VLTGAARMALLCRSIQEEEGMEYRSQFGLGIGALVALFATSGCNVEVRAQGEYSDTSSVESELSAPAGSTAWVARHGLTGAQYQAEFDKWVGQGYRLTYVNGYSVGAEARYAAIWDKVPSGTAWVARHGLTSAQYQTEFNSLTAQGFRPVLVSGYGLGGADHYAAIFEKSSAGAWIARHGMTPAQYQAEFNTQTAQGYRPLHISAFTVNGQDRYAAIWIKKAGPAWVARHGLSSSQYQAEFNHWVSQGYQLTQVSGYTAGGAERYAAVWEQVSGAPPWFARHGISSSTYQLDFNDLRYQGYRPMVVSGYDVGGSTRYAAIWVNAAFSRSDLATIDSIVNRYMAPQPTVGLSLAITRNDRLVFAKGYGVADKSSGAPVRTNSLFRVASVSKPITSAAIMSLVQDGKLNLGDKVFGNGAILGTTYGTQPYSQRLKAITVRHLLEHTAGGWTNNGNDPMFQQPNLGVHDLISWTLDNQPQINDPGTTYAYSNFGYCLLGRILERKTGLAYDAYVKNRFLTPAGATAMAIGGDTLAQRLPNEVVYYGNGNPYGMKVTRMDSHGGWVATPVDLLRFVTRVDNLGVIPDFLTPATITTMTTPSAVNAGYALGWGVNVYNHWWHTGYLTGTLAEIARLNNGFNFAMMTNSNGSNDANLDAMMWEIIGAVQSWPAHNLF
jgi:CubicO group peptidase (beta-lactamase class C family)